MKQSSLLENQLQKGSTIAKSIVENFGQDDFWGWNEFYQKSLIFSKKWGFFLLFLGLNTPPPPPMPPFLASMKKYVPNKSLQNPLGKDKMLGYPNENWKVSNNFASALFNSFWWIMDNGNGTLLYVSNEVKMSKLTEPGWEPLL